MRIVFVGSVRFSLVCLERLLALGADVVGVVTVAAERSHLNTDYADLGSFAERHGIPTLRVRQISESANVEWIRDRAPDIMFVFGFSQLLSEELLAIPVRGCVGTHPALLPRNRGRHPIIWALVEGLTETGLTFLYLDEGVDSGDILWQERIVIDDADDALSLYDKIERSAVQAFERFLPALTAGTAARVPQDHSRASYWRKRGEADGLIDWTRSSREIRNLVRGLTRPYVGAHAIVEGTRTVFWKVEFADAASPQGRPDALPGTFRTDSSGGWQVRTGDGWLNIVESAPPLQTLFSSSRLTG